MCHYKHTQKAETGRAPHTRFQRQTSNAMFTYTQTFDGADLTTGREVAKKAIRKAIERRRKAKADWADARISMEHVGWEEIDGEMATVRRVWARQDEEEFLIYEIGGANDEVRVEPQTEHHTKEMPKQTRFGLR